MLSAFRNFFITLLVSLLIFGILGALITDYALDTVGIPRIGAKETEPSPDETGNDPSETSHGSLDPSDPAKKDSHGITALLIGTDYQPDVFDDYDLSEINEQSAGFPLPERRVTADTILIVHLDKKSGQILFCRIPSNIRVNDHGLNKKLGDLYADSGREVLQEKLEAMIAMPFDYYAEVDIPGMKKIIDEIGGLEYKVPRDMYYYDEEEDYTINLHKGLQKLDGEGVLQLLRFNGYGDDGSARLTTAVNVLKTIASKMTSDRSYYDNAKSLFPILSSYLKTDFTEEDLAKELDLLFLYPNMETVTVSYPGQSVTIDGELYYEINLVSGRALFSAYKYTGK